MSGKLKPIIKEKITANSDSDIADLFAAIVDIRNRIIHSFRITAPVGMTDDILIIKC